jgi:hypothetical protein
MKSLELREEALYFMPHRSWFIYADQESVDSIVKSGLSDREKYYGNGYFLRIIVTGLARPRWHRQDENGVWMKDFQKGRAYEASLTKKFKGFELLEAYSMIAEDSWPGETCIDKNGFTTM